LLFPPIISENAKVRYKKGNYCEKLCAGVIFGRFFFLWRLIAASVLLAHLGRKYWGRHLWSRGYCVSTIGLDKDKIRRYVKWQEEKDKEDETGSTGQGSLF